NSFKSDSAFTAVTRSSRSRLTVLSIGRWCIEVERDKRSPARVRDLVNFALVNNEQGLSPKFHRMLVDLGLPLPQTTNSHCSECGCLFCGSPVDCPGFTHLGGQAAFTSILRLRQTSNQNAPSVEDGGTLFAPMALLIGFLQFVHARSPPKPKEL